MPKHTCPNPGCSRTFPTYQALGPHSRFCEFKPKPKALDYSKLYETKEDVQKFLDDANLKEFSNSQKFKNDPKDQPGWKFCPFCAVNIPDVAPNVAMFCYSCGHSLKS